MNSYIAFNALLMLFYDVLIINLNKVKFSNSSTRDYFITCQWILYKGLRQIFVKSSIFSNIIPCNLLKVNWHFGGVLFATCITLVSCLAYSLTLKMEETWSSEMSLNLQWTTWRYTLHSTLLWEPKILQNICGPLFNKNILLLKPAFLVIEFHVSRGIRLIFFFYFTIYYT
jgi:hypothetical protein